MKPCEHCGSVGHEGSSSMTNLCEHIQLIVALRRKNERLQDLHTACRAAAKEDALPLGFELLNILDDLSKEEP